MKRIETVQDLITRWGAILLSEDLTLYAVENEIGDLKISHDGVKMWKSRKKIPQIYWRPMIELAPKRNIRISLSKLALMHV